MVVKFVNKTQLENSLTELGNSFTDLTLKWRSI